jgi:hypothetical protein
LLLNLTNQYVTLVLIMISSHHAVRTLTPTNFDYAYYLLYDRDHTIDFFSISPLWFLLVSACCCSCAIPSSSTNNKKKKKNYFPFSCFYARHIWTVPKLSSFLFHYYLLKIYNETHEAMSIEMPTGKGKWFLISVIYLLNLIQLTE